MRTEDIAAIVESAIRELDRWPAVDMPCLRVSDADELASEFRRRGFDVRKEYEGRMYPIVSVSRHAEKPSADGGADGERAADAL